MPTFTVLRVKTYRATVEAATALHAHDRARKLRGHEWQLTSDTADHVIGFDGAIRCFGDPDAMPVEVVAELKERVG